MKAILATAVVLFAAGAPAAAYGSDLEFGPIVGIDAGSPGDGVPALGGTFAIYADRFNFAMNAAFVPKEESEYKPGSYIDETEVEYAAGGASILYKIKPGKRSFVVGTRYHFSRESYYHHEGRTGLHWSHDDHIAHDHRFLAVGGLQLYRDGPDGTPFAFIWGGLGPAMLKSKGISWWSEGGGGYPENYEEESLTGTAYTLDFVFGFNLTQRLFSFLGISGFAEAYAKTLRFSGPEAVGAAKVDVRAFVGPVFIL